MKEFFEELEVEVDQHVVDRKHDEIERKNLLIANDNLIADCLFKDVFHVATNSELNVSSFTEMHHAHTNLKARCLELEVELSNLQSFRNNTSPPTRDVPDFDSVFVIEKMKASIQGKDNAIKKLRMQISQLNETRSEADRTLDFTGPLTFRSQILLLLPIDNDHFINVFAPEPRSEASSSGDLSSTESPYVSQTLHRLEKWSKDHPLHNIIGNPSRSVSTRKQLAIDALWCLYNSVLSKVEPKNFKSAITEYCWFQAMQDEIHEFDR
ncbi:hypothetical protein Tco_0512166 [Tanacetum coccineum]